MQDTKDQTFKPKLDTNRRYEVIVMHLLDDQVAGDTPLCVAGVSVHDLISVDYYLERRQDGLPVGNVCDTCKIQAVRWAKERCQTLEADAGVCLAKARGLRERDAMRYRKNVEEAKLDANRLLDKAEEYRLLADTLTGEGDRPER